MLLRVGTDVCYITAALRLEVFLEGFLETLNRDFQCTDIGLKCLCFALHLSSASEAQKALVSLK